MRTVNTEAKPDAGFERRSKPRLYKPFRVRAYGLGSDGSAFEVATVLKNMSSGGLYFCMQPSVKIGARLGLTVRLSSFERDDVAVAQVAIEGVVVRTEPQPNGDNGIAVAIKKYKFVS